jgi:transcriptional regulator with XRE-family HTH domain
VVSRTPEADPRVQLGELLKLAREQTPDHKTQEAVGRMTRLTRSAIGHGETGERVPSNQTLALWLDALGVQGLARVAIEKMHRLARLMERDPSEVAVAPWYPTEARAHTLLFWNPTMVPGLVQTPAYAREMFVAVGQNALKVEESLEIRLGRQAILTRADAPDITIVLWEPVLHHQIGTRQDMHEQCNRLVEVSDLPNVSLHILPSDGANAGLGGAIGLAATDDAPELLASGAVVEDQLSQEPSLVRKARATFRRVRADALNSAHSRSKLTEAAERWQS